MNPSEVFQPMSFEHFLGTDSLGRDFLFRLVLGFRNTIGLSFFAMFISFISALILASLVVRLPKRIKFLTIRFVAIIESIPDILFIGVLSVGLLTVFGEVLNLIFAISLGGVFIFLRYFINLFSAELAKPYYESARAMGVSGLRLLAFYLWPNQKNILLTYAFVCLPAFLTIESALSFLGIGIQPPHATLGNLMADGWKYVQIKPILFFIPGVALLLANLFFDRLKMFFQNRT